MKIKTSELIGAQLDWAVAVCLGLKPRMRHRYMREKAAANNYQGDLAWHLAQQTNDPITVFDGVTSPLEDYSTDWAQGGPIIEREKIKVDPVYGDVWVATIDNRPAYETNAYEEGPTPLIAAMLCYTASKLGDEVDVPEELK